MRRSGRGRARGHGWRAVAGVVIGLGLGAWGAAAGCGARTPLDPPGGGDDDVRDAAIDRGPDVLPTGDFCAEKSYDSGPTDLSMFVVVDRSGSMDDDGRWQSVSAALSAFASDPQAEGIGMGMQFYPLSTTGDCSKDDYTIPAVPIAKLPSNAAAVQAALAAKGPGGETPTLPALRGGIEYSRGVVIANPKERVVIALVTDGVPNACESTAEKVAALAAEAASTDPKILTYVIGLATGYTDEIALMASAGGTGKPILVDDGAGAAQTLVDAMLSVKLAQEKCVFGVPIPPGAVPAPNDLSVRYRVSPGAPAKELPMVADFASCAGEAFFPDDLETPGSVSLCPASCNAVHAAPASQVTVTAGCGMGNDGGLPDANPDAKDCPTIVEFSCVTACGSAGSAPACIDGAWTCPPGTFSDEKCTTCPATPHICCAGDGTFSQASCVNGEWTCAPGDVLYGNPGCTPPEVCTASLGCAFGSFCDLPDDSCGEGIFLGECKPMPGSCPGGGPKVCTCTGAVSPSACAASQSGLDVNGNGDCNPPFGTFECGGYFCESGKQVCRKTTTLGATVADAYVCLDIPPGCGNGCGCQLCDPCPSPPCGFCSAEPEGTFLDCTTIVN